MKVRLESNFNLSFLKSALSLNEPQWLIEEGGFDLLNTNIYDKNSKLYTADYDVLVVYVNIDYLSEFLIFSDPFGCDIDDEYHKIEKAIDSFFLLVDTFHSKKPNVPVCVFSFPNQPNTSFNYLETNTLNYSINKLINDINFCLTQRVAHTLNAYLFNINNLVLNYGYKTLFDKRMWYLAKSPFSNIGANYVASELKSFLKCINEPRKKVLVLDLDNTLWGGVIGEDGINGILISSDGNGKAFFDFQNEIVNLKKRGVLLALCSKNNESDVKDVFLHHHDMVLNWDDFIVKKINWDDKASNLRAIAEELNLGLDSLVFIDDNPTERLWVKTELPEVFVPDFPFDPSELKEFLLSLDVFNVFSITNEDTRKTNAYETELKRNTSRKEHLSYEEFLDSLNIQCIVNDVSESNIKRVTQLLGKTNQFNLTTKRYSEGEIQQFIKDPLVKVLSLSVNDKFGDYGLVGVIIIKNNDNKAILDTFLLSCRVLGKKIEDYFLAIAYKSAGENWGSTQFLGLFKPTNKNVQVENFYKERGFEFVIEKNSTHYFSIKNPVINFPEHIKV